MKIADPLDPGKHHATSGRLLLTAEKRACVLHFIISPSI